ncbi:MAG: RNA-binding protein [Oscillospiraceae bacterium]|jgi:RNA-binding protein YlmH|nr:RNA-binding protein [Oscillospiraceae bacterium]
MEERGFDGAALTQEEKQLLARVIGQLERAQEREIAAASCFLTPREQMLLRRQRPQTLFFGGTANAQRAMAYYLPDYLSREAYFDDGPIACLHAHFYASEAPTHRDFLGALLGAGIRHDTIGDIAVSEGMCQFFVTAALAPYLLENFTSAGRTHLKLEQVPLSQALAHTQAMREVRVTVSSLRLDSVLAAVFHLSRGDAADAVRAGRVRVNYADCLKPDRALCMQDEISLRGVGKLRLLEEHGVSKKGRIAVTAGIYC